VTDLRATLKSNGLSVKGNKDELIKRLTDFRTAENGGESTGMVKRTLQTTN